MTALLVYGCVSSAPLASRAAAPADTGALVVYTARRVPAYAQSEYPVHTAYGIYRPDGALLERVANLAGSFYQDPEAVPLPPGAYRVRALAARGEASVLVQIVAGRTTVVDLQRGKQPACGADL